MLIAFTALALIVVGLLVFQTYKLNKLQDLTAGIWGIVLHESESLLGQFQAYSYLDRCLGLDKPLPSLRGWAASPDFLLVVLRHALANRPTVILECGSGASTVVLARCMQLNGSGHVFSLESSPTYAARTREQLADHGLHDWATVVDAPLNQLSTMPKHVWYSLANLPKLESKIDMLVIDGPPSSTCQLARYPAMPMLRELLSDSCNVFLDDANRADEKEAVSRWLLHDESLKASTIDCEKGCVRLEIDVAVGIVEGAER